MGWFSGVKHEKTDIPCHNRCAMLKTSTVQRLFEPSKELIFVVLISLCLRMGDKFCRHYLPPDCESLKFLCVSAELFCCLEKDVTKKMYRMEILYRAKNIFLFENHVYEG